jgi:hypothetical protein
MTSNDGCPPDFAPPKIQGVFVTNLVATLRILWVVVAIILVGTAIAIPNLLRAKIAANQASAVGSLRTLNTACIHSTNS